MYVHVTHIRLTGQFTLANPRFWEVGVSPENLAEVLGDKPPQRQQPKLRIKLHSITDFFMIFNFPVFSTRGCHHEVFLSKKTKGGKITGIIRTFCEVWMVQLYTPFELQAWIDSQLLLLAWSWSAVSVQTSPTDRGNSDFSHQLLLNATKHNVRSFTL